MKRGNPIKKIRCEIYTRCVGYFRPVSGWNDGKQTEFRQRKEFTKYSGGTMSSEIYLSAAELVAAIQSQKTLLLISRSECERCEKIMETLAEKNLASKITIVKMDTDSRTVIKVLRDLGHDLGCVDLPVLVGVDFVVDGTDENFVNITAGKVQELKE